MTAPIVNEPSAYIHCQSSSSWTANVGTIMFKEASMPRFVKTGSPDMSANPPAPGRARPSAPCCPSPAAPGSRSPQQDRGLQIRYHVSELK